jgi:hypothetical protein
MTRIVFVNAQDMVQLTAEWPEWRTVRIHHENLYPATGFDVILAARPCEVEYVRLLARLLGTKKIEDPRTLFARGILRRADEVALVVPVGESYEAGGKTSLPLTGREAGGGGNAYPTPPQALLPRQKAHATQLHKRLMNRLPVFDRSPLWRERFWYFCKMPRRPIDTLHLVKRLQEAGFSPAQAEAQVEVLLELYALQETATKSDLKKLRILSKKDVAQTEARLQAEIRETEARLQAEIEKVRLELRETEARLQAEIRETEARLRAEIEKVRLELRETEARLQAEIQKLRIDLQKTEAQLKADTEKLRYEVEALRLEVEKLKISLQETEKRLTLNIQETEKRLLLNIQETEARLRTDILRAQVRIVLWIAGLIAAQIPIFYLLRRFLLP